MMRPNFALDIATLSLCMIDVNPNAFFCLSAQDVEKSRFCVLDRHQRLSLSISIIKKTEMKLYTFQLNFNSHIEFNDKLLCLPPTFSPVSQSVLIHLLLSFDWTSDRVISSSSSYIKIIIIVYTKPALHIISCM